MNAFEAYKTYLAIKKHFTVKRYNAISCNFKCKVSDQNLLKIKNIKIFEKLSEHKDLKSLLISNMSANPRVWAFDIAYSENCKQIYENWLKINQSLTYVIKSDLNKFDEDFNYNFQIINNEHPYIIKLFLRKEITLETLVVMSDVVGCLKKWNKCLTDVVSKEILLKINKYLLLMKYDKEMIQKICIKKFSDK